MKALNRTFLLVLSLAAATASAQLNFTTLHHFSDPSVRASLAEPVIIGPGGVLFGVTQNGGAGDAGLLYRLSADGATYTVLRQFGLEAAKGAKPSGAVLLGGDGFLYGATEVGGTTTPASSTGWPPTGPTTRSCITCQPGTSAVPCMR